ncbi:hypothetical protein ACNOYE_12085 [Nannocystaceae bacterium ST9]
MDPKRMSGLWSAGLPLGLAIALSLPSPACIIPDYCILFSWQGANWCAPMMSALKWPEGHPELAQPVLAEDFGLPRGCTCVNDTESTILADKLPSEAYIALRGEIEMATREACLTLAVGYANNCLVTSGVDAPTILEEVEDPDEVGPCIGDCEFIKPPPYKDCPRNPTPFECEEFVVTGGDDEADDGSCPIGAEDCPCTAGGACDTNLECIEGMCTALPTDEEADGGSDTALGFDCPEETCEEIDDARGAQR